MGTTSSQCAVRADTHVSVCSSQEEAADAAAESARTAAPKVRAGLEIAASGNPLSISSCCGSFSSCCGSFSNLQNLHGDDSCLLHSPCFSRCPTVLS